MISGRPKPSLHSNAASVAGYTSQYALIAVLDLDIAAFVELSLCLSLVKRCQNLVGMGDQNYGSETLFGGSDNGPEFIA